MTSAISGAKQKDRLRKTTSELTVTVPKQVEIVYLENKYEFYCPVINLTSNTKQ